MDMLLHTNSVLLLSTWETVYKMDITKPMLNFKRSGSQLMIARYNVTLKN